MAKETGSGLPKVQFTKTLRGYACDEVDTYFAHANDRYLAVVRECSELKKKMAVVAAGQNEFREEALREKKRITDEADELWKEKKAAADTLITEAEQKAAMILSKAEVAAAGILRQAEAEAEEIRQKNAAQLESCRDTERKIRSHNNTADRLVAEIDSFREKVYAMYAGHIEALEQLSQLTDDFYKAKEELTADTEVFASDAVAEPIETPHDTTMDSADVATIVEEDEDLLHIDWQEHKQKRATKDAEEAEKMANKTLWEIANEANAAAAETPQAQPLPDEHPLPDTLFKEPDAEDLWEDPVIEPEADEPVTPIAEEPTPAEPAVPEEETDLLEDLERDLLSAYAKGGVDGAEDAIDAFDLESLMAEDEPVADKTDGGSDGESEEDFLADIASEYLTKTPLPETQTDDTAHDDITATDADSLDELLDDESSHDVSLTGEFDKIFSSKKSAAYVDEVSRQPLMEAAKPEKPKKHK